MWQILRCWLEADWLVLLIQDWYSALIRCPLANPAVVPLQGHQQCYAHALSLSLHSRKYLDLLPKCLLAQIS